MTQMQINILTDYYFNKLVKPNGCGAGISINRKYLKEKELIAIPYIEDFIQIDKQEDKYLIMLKTEDIYPRTIKSSLINIPSKYMGREILLIPKNSQIQANILTKKFKIIQPTLNDNGLFINLQNDFTKTYFTSIIINNNNDVKIYEKENGLFLLEVNPIEILTKKPLKNFDYCRLQLPIHYKNFYVLLIKSEFQ